MFGGLCGIQAQERYWWTSTETQLLLGILKYLTYRQSLRAVFVQPGEEAVWAVLVTSWVVMQKTDWFFLKATDGQQQAQITAGKTD